MGTLLGKKVLGLSSRNTPDDPHTVKGKYMKNEQNTSYAVMSQRYLNENTLDDFPTPPGLLELLLKPNYYCNAIYQV